MNNTFVVIISSIFASTGFWTLVNTFIQSKSEKQNSRDQLLIGLAHDRICWLGEHYIKIGSISKDDYESLYDYLYKPYKALGGNGTAERIMEKVKKLPFTEENHGD